MVAALDLADLPDFELSDSDIFTDDSLFGSSFSSPSPPESPSDDSSWETWSWRSTRGSPPDKLDDSDLEEGTAEECEGISV